MFCNHAFRMKFGFSPVTIRVKSKPSTFVRFTKKQSVPTKRTPNVLDDKLFLRFVKNNLNLMKF